MTPVTSGRPVRGRQIVRGRWITAFSTTLRAQGAEFAMEPGRGWTSHWLFDWSSGGVLAGLRPKQQVAAAPTRAQRQAHAQHDVQAGRQIITEELFGGVLERERRRADRFDEVFAVLLIELKPAAAERPAVVNTVIDALGVTMRESDVLGWVERPVVIGAILAPVQSLSREAARDVESRVRREFASRLDDDTLAGISIRLFVHRGLHGLGRRCDRRRAHDACGTALRAAATGLRCLQARARRDAERRHAGAAASAAARDCRAGQADLARPRAVPAAAYRTVGQAVHDAEIPHDEGQRRARGAPEIRDRLHQVGQSGATARWQPGVQDHRRSSGDSNWTFSP